MGQAEGNSGLNRKYLRLADLRRLRNLFFSSRRVVEGVYAGRHASGQRGHSVEFQDFRQYMPGDEIGDIDWKVYGRSDKLFVKLFEHQSEMTVNLLVDASASMGFAGVDGGDSKYDHACRLAAAIGFLTAKQQDRVSFAVAQEGLKGFQRPHGSMPHLIGILLAMEQVTCRGRARLGETLHQLAAVLGRKGLLVVFSDLLDDQEEIFKGLSLFTHRGTEVILIQVLHHEELNLPDLQDAVFLDSENGRRLSLHTEDVRAAYAARLRRFVDGWSAACRGRGIDHKVVSTATHYNKALEQYLFQRTAMG
jgi:uncharacterized protein (DUF58 family)